MSNHEILNKEVIHKVDILDQGIQRFAVSGLSKQRYTEAVKEEMLMEKYTGEFLIKNKDGVIVSADTINRSAAAFANAVLTAEQTGICGDIYLLEVDNVVAPNIVQYDVNLLSEPLTLDEGIGRVLFNFDVSEYKYVDDLTQQLEKESSVEVVIKSGEEKSIVKVLKINEMNRWVFDSSKHFGPLGAPLRIESIKIKCEPEFVGVKEVKTILHNVFITINKEVK